MSENKPKNLLCPSCGNESMVPRTSAKGKFWGCKYYPNCTGTRDINGESKFDRELREEDDAQREPEERYRFMK